MAKSGDITTPDRAAVIPSGQRRGRSVAPKSKVDLRIRAVERGGLAQPSWLDEAQAEAEARASLGRRASKLKQPAPLSGGFIAGNKITIFHEDGTIETKDLNNYNKGTMAKPARDLNAEAAKLGYTFESALATLRQAKDAGRETTVRTKVKPRAKKKANPELTATRLKAAYGVLVRESDLANPALSDDERLRRSVNLARTYDRIRQHDPAFHDNAEELRLARRFLNSRNHQRRQAAKLAAA